MPLSFVLTTIVCLFVGSTVFQFSKYVPSSGGYYSFATRGLGSRSGFMATWSYLIYEIIGAAAAVGLLGYLVSDTLKGEFGLSIPWWIIATATTALIWGLRTARIQLSVRISTILGALELVIMLALGITFLIHPRPRLFLPCASEARFLAHHFGGILGGMIFSVLALAGFESPAPLAQEARLPGKFIGQAVMLSVSVSVSSTSSCPMPARSAGALEIWLPSPPIPSVLRTRPSLWGAGWWFVVFALVNCCVAVGIACTNSASRVMYTMGRAGTLPASFGRIHPTHLTPAVAIGVAQIVGDDGDPSGRLNVPS